MKELKLPVLNLQADNVGEKSVDAELFGADVAPFLVSQAVRVFLTRQRKAMAKTKTRGEITGTTAKIWKQKGTGRARHGDRQAPIFVGGSKAHGPTGKQNYAAKLNRKMNRKAIFSALSTKLKEKKVFLLEEMKISKTKQAGSFLTLAKEKHQLKGKVSLFSGPNEEEKKYFGNLSNVQVLNAANINVYDILSTQAIFFTQQGIAEILKKGKTQND